MDFFENKNINNLGENINKNKELIDDKISKEEFFSFIAIEEEKFKKEEERMISELDLNEEDRKNLYKELEEVNEEVSSTLESSGVLVEIESLSIDKKSGLINKILEKIKNNNKFKIAMFSLLVSISNVVGVEAQSTSEPSWLLVVKEMQRMNKINNEKFDYPVVFIEVDKYGNEDPLKREKIEANYIYHDYMNALYPEATTDAPTNPLPKFLPYTGEHVDQYVTPVSSHKERDFVINWLKSSRYKEKLLASDEYKIEIEKNPNFNIDDYIKDQIKRVEDVDVKYYNFGNRNVAAATMGRMWGKKIVKNMGTNKSENVDFIGVSPRIRKNNGQINPALIEEFSHVANPEIEYYNERDSLYETNFVLPKRELDKRFWITWEKDNGKKPNKFTKFIYEADPYLNIPTEVYAKFMIIRNGLGVSPNDIVTPEMMENYYHSLKDNVLIERIIKKWIDYRYPNAEYRKELSDKLNIVASVENNKNNIKGQA